MLSGWLAYFLAGFYKWFINHRRDKKIDVNEEIRNQLGEGGLVSQNQINIDRENQMIGQWKQLFKKASSGSLVESQQPLASSPAYPFSSNYLWRMLFN